MKRQDLRDIAFRPCLILVINGNQLFLYYLKKILITRGVMHDSHSSKIQDIYIHPSMALLELVPKMSSYPYWLTVIIKWIY